jgi:hypothetical protein
VQALECDVCSRETSSDEPFGGWILRTPKWSACIAPGWEAPGFVMLELRRHSVGLVMDEEEANELGLHLTRLNDAITSVCGAERVYVLSLNEARPHLHFLLGPRAADATEKYRGLELFRNVKELNDPDSAATVATALRDALSAGAPKSAP